MAEPDVVVERRIAASPELLWAMVSDVTRMGEWSPETTACKWTKGASGPEVGARFRGANRRGVRRWSTTCEVTAADPGERFVFDVRVGPIVYAAWGYELEPDGDGATRVRETWEDRRGWVMKKLGAVVSGVSDRATHNRAGMEETLRRLEAAASGSAASGSTPAG
jgi:uncharacterized protein YndB with AHSA1/START domain